MIRLRKNVNRHRMKSNTCLELFGDCLSHHPSPDKLTRADSVSVSVYMWHEALLVPLSSKEC